MPDVLLYTCPICGWPYKSQAAAEMCCEDDEED